jgi:quercetin dioxygenase-like cupin family protein
MAILRYIEDNWDEIRKGVFRKIVYMEDIMTVLIEFRNGPWIEADPFHSHPHEQTCYIAKGDIILSCEGEPDQQLTEGDMFYIPSRKKHTIRVISSMARLIDSFSPIREEFL